MAHLTSKDRENILNAAREAGTDVRFIGTNRTIIDTNTFFGRSDAIRKLKG